MQITYQEETVEQIEKDIKPLIQLHWEQIALNKDVIKLNPDWDEYKRLNDLGFLRVFTARDGDEMVGYFIITVSKSMHYKDHIFANCDIIYVRPDKRAGLTGYKLINYVENWCKNNDVSCLHINTKVHAPFDKLLERMEYDNIERLYAKCFR